MQDVPQHSLDAVDYHPDELVRYHKNARRGDVEAIARSLETNGQYRRIVVNLGTHTGRPLEVLAGNHTLDAARHLGWSSIAAEVVDVDDKQAARIVAADNRTADLGNYDNDALIELLREAGDLDGTGYDTDALEALIHDSKLDEYKEQREAEHAEHVNAVPRRRTKHLDLIFSNSAATHAYAHIGYALGWWPGIITSKVTSARQYRERFPRGKRILFMDNEWHDYDHAQHVAALAEFHPKYATTRDILTQQQAAASGAEFLTLDTILAQAEDVAQHCDNVILIPKYDCLDQLPSTIGGKPVVLGYSVHSSYGGTDLPPSAFKGWPVHLLGGSWKKQRAILAQLGDDVVSLDNNNLLLTSQFGTVSQIGGESRNISDILGVEDLHGRHQAPSVVLSLEMIMQDVIRNFAAPDDPILNAADDVDEAGVDIHDFGRYSDDIDDDDTATVGETE